jgi:hypothetical protein
VPFWAHHASGVLDGASPQSTEEKVLTDTQGKKHGFTVRRLGSDNVVVEAFGSSVDTLDEATLSPSAAFSAVHQPSSAAQPASEAETESLQQTVVRERPDKRMHRRYLSV